MHKTISLVGEANRIAIIAWKLPEWWTPIFFSRLF